VVTILVSDFGVELSVTISAIEIVELSPLLIFLVFSIVLLNIVSGFEVLFKLQAVKVTASTNVKAIKKYFFAIFIMYISLFIGFNIVYHILILKARGGKCK